MHRLGHGVNCENTLAIIAIQVLLDSPTQLRIQERKRQLNERMRLLKSQDLSPGNPGNVWVGFWGTLRTRALYLRSGSVFIEIDVYSMLSRPG